MDRIKEAIALLRQAGCCFWACDGPDAPFVDMKTCKICSAIKLLEVDTEFGSGRAAAYKGKDKRPMKKYSVECEINCESCGRSLGSDMVCDSQGGSYCWPCVTELIEQGSYSSVEEFQGFDD